jgi:nucleotide-binding universal stress UspA family protein
VAVVVWISEGTWPACVDAARGYAPVGAEVVLLHVSGQDVSGVAHGALAGLLGRGRAGHPGQPGQPGQPGHDPGARWTDQATTSARQLLAAAAERLGRECTQVERSGRVEHEVVAAAEGAELLVLARDGDRPAHVGPRSLGPASRFVVDHAVCPVLLVWPESAR